MNRTLILKSPAKINLFLRIVSRRNDGYHNLASLFQSINLCDTLHFSLDDHDLLTCTDVSLPVDETNLISKAVSLFRRKTGINFGLRIHLEKLIPRQAGLGGGSSNAATTLWAMNQLSDSPVSLEQLIEWAGEIGSDVAFFFSSGTAYCTGRGEIIESLPALPSTSLWIVKPDEGLSTPEVYRKLDLSLLELRDPYQCLQGFLKGTSHYFNDLEIPAFAIKPQLASLKQRLMNDNFTTVLMSGSGSSFSCMGKNYPPDLPGVISYPAQFTHRLLNQWY